MHDSVKKSLSKYNKTKDQASKAGMDITRGLKPKIHPNLVSRVDEKEQMLMDFREQLKTYKPKSSGLEIGIMRTKDEAKIGKFREAIQE